MLMAAVVSGIFWPYFCTMGGSGGVLSIFNMSTVLPYGCTSLSQKGELVKLGQCIYNTQFSFENISTVLYSKQVKSNFVGNY